MNTITNAINRNSYLNKTIDPIKAPMADVLGPGMKLPEQGDGGYRSDILELSEEGIDRSKIQPQASEITITCQDTASELFRGVNSIIKSGITKWESSYQGKDLPTYLADELKSWVDDMRSNDRELFTAWLKQEDNYKAIRDGNPGKAYLPDDFTMEDYRSYVSLAASIPDSMRHWQQWIEGVENGVFKEEDSYSTVAEIKEKGKAWVADMMNNDPEVFQLWLERNEEYIRSGRTDLAFLPENFNVERCGANV